MEERYDPQRVEQEAQAFWQRNHSFEVTEDPSRRKFYCLSMLPYPSGHLHMGHVRNYTIGDVMSRYQRMLGCNVLQPMGWDAFGLPAENAAIQRAVPPAEWTYQNIEHMRGQFKRMGFAYDWTRELTTCRPEYYRWEQWFFNRLLEKGLAYRKNAVVNWDPIDQTVLANEQVVDGKGWRSGAVVEKREIPQWFIRITAYADELLSELDQLDGWPESVKTMQRNWIGRSIGLEVDFALADGGEPLKIFTTRPDTIFGATFMAVSADHPLARVAAADDSTVARFIEACRAGGVSEADLETMEKKGEPLGIDAVNPLSGERIPIWVANFVLIGYGTGAIMAVPAHDQRDHMFATRYGLPIRQVIAPVGGAAVDVRAVAWVEKDETVTVNSGEFTGLDYDSAFERIADYVESLDIGRRQVNYRIRDWGVSRQRYWGCPIPVVHCDHCGVVPVPDEALPVLLPEDVTFMGVQSPIKADPEWRRTGCPECGRAAERETDTFDTFVESSWYYARYCTPGAQSMLDERADYWLPVDHYIGGIEHAVMHLLYFRFWHKLMRDAGIVNSDEPATRLLCQGMVLAEAYYHDSEESGRTWVRPDDVSVERDEKGKIIRATWQHDGSEVTPTGWTTMSKSKNNGVDPQQMIDRYGADTVRLFAMFASPPEQALEWKDDAVAGSLRFLRRLWALVHRHREALLSVPEERSDDERDDETQQFRRQLYTVLARVNRDMARYQFNTVVAACMELFNTLDRFDPRDSTSRRSALYEALDILIRVLAPIVPHLSHYLWQSIGRREALLDAPWPEVDNDALAAAHQTLAVQVNGKLRGQIEVPVQADELLIRALVLADGKISRHVAESTIRRFIVVPGKLVNIVV
ncbi:MAG: leucine--tRNA ligase [Arenicellales bacterium]|nr:leucine--tRNA ligase [Arenicellales bacterium]